jgi:hypothetical protein
VPDEKITSLDEGIQAVGEDLVITRSTTVLRKRKHWSNKIHFVNSDYDKVDCDHLHDRMLILTQQDWVQFGAPETITIVIEIGDQLNDGTEPRAIQEDELK